MKNKQLIRYVDQRGKKQIAISDGEKFYAVNDYGFRIVKPEEYKPAKVKPEIRKIYEELLEAIKALEECERIQRDSRQVIVNTHDKLQKANGLLTTDEFSERLLKGLGLTGCSFFVGETSLVITKETYIEKWYNGPMLYEEYDRTLHLSLSTPKAKKEYKSLINRYAKKLPLKAKYEVDIRLGDKATLYMVEDYTIKFAKEFTAETCDNLIKKVRGY